MNAEIFAQAWPRLQRTIGARLHALLYPAADEAQLQRRLHRITTASFVAALLIGGTLSTLYVRMDVLRARATVDAVAANHAALLEERLSHALSATNAIAAALRQGEGKIDDFDSLGSELLRAYGGLASVQLAKHGVISQVVPYVGNASVLGYDLLADAEIGNEARQAVAQRRLMMQGPMQTRQGDHAVIGRLPVFLGHEKGHQTFWGFSTVVVRVADLIAESGLEQMARQGFHYQLVRLAPDGSTSMPFASSGQFEPGTSLTRSFDVANGRWQLHIAPAAGWLSGKVLGMAAGATLLFALLVAGFAHASLRHPLLLQRQVGERTRELAESNRRLRAEAAERARAQREASHTNRLYNVLSQTNALMMRVSESERLLEGICRIAVETGGFSLARIALIDEGSEPGRGWHWHTRHGSVSDLPACDDQIAAFIAQGYKATAVTCGMGNSCTANTDTEKRTKEQGTAPNCEQGLCAQAAAAGFLSHATLQLRMRGRCVGVFSLHAREADAFDAAQLALLEEMTGDVAFALEAIEREESRRRTETRLRKLSRAVEQSASAILITDSKGIIEYVNPWFTRITGYQPEEVVGKTPALLRSPDTHPETYRRLWEALLSGKEWTGELHNTKKNGERYWCLETISPLKDENGEITHFVAVTEDISERKENEQTIRHLAFHDPLTALPNRRLFNDRLHQAVVMRHRKDRGFALALIDIDRFKTVNDTFGHEAGDALLKAIAERLSPHVLSGDTLARMGGDEFGLLAMDIRTPDEAARLAERLRGALDVPFQLYGQELYVTVSIGLTLFPHDGSDADILVRNADTALFRAKDQGRNTYQFFTADMNEAMLERLRLENAMRHAISRSEFLLHFQPQVDIATGAIAGAEALIRWRHPELGMVSPATFIPLAEETGLIVDIGEWVLRTACAQAKEWERAGKPLRVAVNVSARQFRQGDLADIVRATLTEFGLDPQWLEIELTEGILMGDTDETRATLESLHAMGVQISIDDFGTGYSSLSYLKRLPIQILKIDQSFVRDIHHDADDRAIVAAVIALAHSMKLRVIAEGVETLEQLAFLRERDCDLMQGYLFSRPITGAELLALQQSGAQLKV